MLYCTYKKDNYYGLSKLTLEREMDKPTLSEVLALLELKEKEKELAKLISARTREIIDTYGEGRFDYESTDPEDDSRKYLSLTVVDELKAMIEGKDSGRFVYTKKESSKVTYLKGKPKTM
jgi:hypothetical protein